MRRKLLSIVFCGLFATSLCAETITYEYDIEVDGLRYRKLTESTVEVSTASQLETDGIFISWTPSAFTQQNVKIPATITHDGHTYEVVSIGDVAFYGRESIISITIPNSVTSIGGSAFKNCTNLVYVIIPNSISIIRGETFYDCTSLSSITIGSGVTSIEDGAFGGCTSLTSVIWNAKNYVRNEDSWQSSPFEGLTPQITSFVFGDGVSSIPDYFCSNMSNVTSITLPNSVTSIGKYAFSGCSGLTTIVVPNSVTSIGGYAFEDCSSLTAINIPDNLTSIEHGTFSGCSGLTSLTIPKNITSISDSFWGCTSLTSIVWNAPHCKGDENMWGWSSCFSSVASQITSFSFGNDIDSIPNGLCNGMSSLTSITIPDGVKDIGAYAFSWCESLMSITIPNSVTKIGESAFSGCRGLLSVVVGKGVTHIGRYAFNYCDKLSSIIVNDGNQTYDSRSKCNAIIETATNTLVQGCSTTIIPNSVTAIGECAFGGMAELVSINIPNQVTSIGDSAFFNCDGLVSITLPNHITRIGNSTFRNCESLASIAIPNNVISIGEEAFYGCTSLASVYIGSGVASIGENAFFDCENLSSIVVNSENVVYDSRDNCNAIIEKTTNTLVLGCSATIIPNSVTSIGDYAYSYCPNLISVVITNGVKSIGDGAFSGCDNLASVTIPSSVISIGEYAFDGCYRLASVIIPNSVTNIGEDAFYGVLNVIYGGNATGAPWGAMNLNGYVDGYLIYDSAAKEHLLACSRAAEGEITIPNSVTSIGNSAFYDCSGVTAVTIGSNVTSIGESAFSHCDTLTSIVIPSSVESIGDEAFRSCENLASLYLCAPSSTIGKEAFAYCSNLTSITCYAQEPPVADKETFGYVDDDWYSRSTLYVLCNSIPEYQADSVWGKFKNIQCIDSEPTTVDGMTAVPTATTVTFDWQSNRSAATYILVVSTDKEVFCSLVFNAKGQLNSIAYAPGRNGQKHHSAAIQTADGFRFTVIGLDEVTHYLYTMTVKDVNDIVRTTYTGEFITLGTPAAVDDVNDQTSSAATHKIFRDGQVLIQRDGKTYTLTGIEVE